MFILKAFLRRFQTVYDQFKFYKAFHSNCQIEIGIVFYFKNASDQTSTYYQCYYGTQKRVLESLKVISTIYEIDKVHMFNDT